MNRTDHSRFRPLLAIAMVAFLVTFSACDNPPEPPETVVTGTVTYQGKPVTGGIIYFQMIDAESGRPYAGEIFDDGTYELTYIVPGEAQIAIDTGTEVGKPTYIDLPKRFSSPTKSGLTYTVVEGPQAHDIVLK